MQLNQVRYFLEAARTLNFTRAASACGISQPALTKGIKTLEDELGGALFHRAPKLCLTALGRRVLPFLEQTLEAANAVRQQALAHGGGEIAPIAIGLDPSVGGVIVLPILSELHRAIPGLSMTLSTVDPEAMSQGLMDGALDLGVRGRDGAPDRRAFHHLPLASEKLTVVCARSHPLANASMIDLQALLSAPDRIAFCRTAEKQLAELGPLPPPRHRAGSREQIDLLIRIGAGWAMLPAASAAALDAISLDLADAEISRVIEVIYPAGRTHSPAVAAFLRLARIGRRPSALKAA